MLFSSMTFLLLFFPITYFVYILIPSKHIKARNIFLLIMSFIFYAWGGVYYFLIMLSSIVINYVAGILVSTQNEKRNKFFLILVLIANLLILFYFKYFNLFIDLVNKVTSQKIEFFDIVLPIGISFFTFQALSYVVDVYLKKTQPQKNIINLALFIAFFPQLIAGPIVKYSDISEQINDRKITAEKTYEGIRRFCYGLAKKVIVANTLAEAVDNIFAISPSEFSSAVLWIGIIYYALQIYFDFSGYSDMAIGLGKMFGFEFRENFNYPYTANSIQDFWRRWHISLSSWFKEYVYIPLGGNRKGKFRTYINLFIVFLLTGLWHGANYTFVVWGIYFGLFLVVERLFLGNILKKNTQNKFFNWLYAMIVVLIGWVFFRSPNISFAFEYIAGMFNFSSGSVGAMTVLTMSSLIIFPIAVLLSGALQVRLSKYTTTFIKTKVGFVVETVLILALLLVCILILSNSTYNPFIYLQF